MLLYGEITFDEYLVDVTPGCPDWVAEDMLEMSQRGTVDLKLDLVQQSPQEAISELRKVYSRNRWTLLRLAMRDFQAAFDCCDRKLESESTSWTQS